MTTYSDVKTRLFYDRDKVIKQRLRRKRSSGRLKQYNSEQDLRSWGTDQNDRRRHILELMSGLKTLWGNYVPFEVLFAQLALMPSDASDAQKFVPKPRRSDSKVQELETQKEDLSGLVKSLTKDANEVRRESVTVKSENDKLKGTVQGLEDELKKLKDQLRACQDQNQNNGDKLKKEAELAQKLKGDLENERRLSQELEDERNRAEDELEAANKQLEDERRSSILAQDRLSKDLEQAEDDADKLKAKLDALEEEKRQSECSDLDKLKRELEDERRSSACAKAANDALERQFGELAKKGAEDAIQAQAALRESMQMEQCLKNELSGLQDENDCLRKEIERLRMVECELAECEIKMQELQCDVESYKCCLDKQEYDAHQMSNVIKEQQDFIFNLQATISSCKSNDNLQSESWGSCNESSVDYQLQIEELNAMVKKQKCLIASQRECLQKQHNYITMQEETRCKLQSQVGKYKDQIKELMVEMDVLRDKRKNLQCELDFLTKKLEHYLEQIQKIENEKSCGQLPARSTNSGRSCCIRDNYNGSISPNRPSTQPDQDLSIMSGRSSNSGQTGCRNRPSIQPDQESLIMSDRSSNSGQTGCRNRACQQNPSSSKKYNYR